MRKNLSKQVWSKKLPITLLFMERVLTVNSQQKVCILIKCENNKIVIPDDFYKHISTY